MQIKNYYLYLASLILLFNTNLIIPAARSSIWDVATATEQVYKLRKSDAENFIINVQNLTSGALLAGILDEKNGPDVARLLQNKLPEALLPKLDTIITDSKEITKIFRSIDHNILNEITNDTVGSTATLVLANNRYLTIAYVGNSQALIAFENGNIMLTTAHAVTGNKSRMFGNKKDKQNKASKPNIIIIDLQQTPIDFVVVASASFWESITFKKTHAELVDLTFNITRKNYNAQQLVDTLLRNSEKNTGQMPYKFSILAIKNKLFKKEMISVNEFIQIPNTPNILISAITAPATTPQFTSLKTLHFFINTLAAKL